MAPPPNATHTDAGVAQRRVAHSECIRHGLGVNPKHHHRRHRRGLKVSRGQQLVAAQQVLQAPDAALDEQLFAFRKQLAQAWDGFHVHMGAGKIGLGLVLPAIVRRGRPFVVVQRFTDKWQHILDVGRASVHVNGKRIADLRVASSVQELQELTSSALGGARSVGSFMDEVIDLDAEICSEGILVLSRDNDVLEALAEKAASYSTAVGGNRIHESFQPMLDAMHVVARGRQSHVALQCGSVSPGDKNIALGAAAAAAVEAAAASAASAAAAVAVAEAAGVKVQHTHGLKPLKKLYCCENDHNAVNDLSAALAGTVDVVPVLVDRVCSSIEFAPGGIINVSTESYAGDIVLPPPSVAVPLPFAGANVHEPLTDLGAKLLHARKLLTVNGTHTTLAFLTLIAAEPDTHGPPKASHELLAFDPDECAACGEDAGIARDLWVWVVARQIMLLTEFHEEVVRHTMKNNSTFGKQMWNSVARTLGEHRALIESLLEGARSAVRRLSGGGDETGRVLGGGVNNRWKTRLVNVAEFLNHRESTGLSPLAQELLAAASVTESEMRLRVEKLVHSSSRFITDENAVQKISEGEWGLTPARPRSGSRDTTSSSETEFVPLPSVGILFDFDGTIGDTESPAMEVAFWEIAPYLPELAHASEAELEAAREPYVRENAGKAFEHMIALCDAKRVSAGLPSVEQTRAAQEEPSAVLEIVDRKRRALGLCALSKMRSEGIEPLSLLTQQKDDTVTRLKLAARACPGVVDALGTLRTMNLPFVIATTSGKPRVPACVDAAGLRDFFPSDAEHIHSGESDFDPPRFKPAPDVYLKAAASLGLAPEDCVAVEDSASGVGSAANAGVGLIIGYVGADHIAADMKESHAHMLMAGTRSDNGRGADVVIASMLDLPMVVEQYIRARAHEDAVEMLYLHLTEPSDRVFFPSH